MDDRKMLKVCYNGSHSHTWSVLDIVHSAYYTGIWLYRHLQNAGSHNKHTWCSNSNIFVYCYYLRYIYNTIAYHISLQLWKWRGRGPYLSQTPRSRGPCGSVGPSPPQSYGMLKFVVGSLGLDSIILTKGSILHHCNEIWVIWATELLVNVVVHHCPEND
jgi:hypothetical protein